LRRRSRALVWLIVIIAAAALFLAWQYIDFGQASQVLPDGLKIGGLGVGGMTRAEALAAVEAALAEPVAVIYQEETLLLPRDTVELRYDPEGTTANLDAALRPCRGVQGFISYVLRRPVEEIDVEISATYSSERLDGYLMRIAGEYDHPPQGPVPLPAELSFRPGRAGYVLDIEASHTAVAAALQSAANCTAELVVEIADAPEPDLDALGELVGVLLEDHPDVTAGVFVKDLQNGDELAINGDVAFSGLSVFKIVILAETYRALEAPLDLYVQDYISDALGLISSNFKANLLLGDVIDDGDGFQGAENVTASLSWLGLRNSFMSAPYDRDCSYMVSTPANSRTDITTDPDPCVQTTAADMGLLLEMIYECSQGGGALMVAYPTAFTASECEEMIAWMARNSFDTLIEANLPEGTVVAHKHGFGDGGPHADAGIVFTPGGDYVLVVYLYAPRYLEWAEGQPLIADISLAAYNYFNPAE
jgi:beta-lactamase class A